MNKKLKELKDIDANFIKDVLREIYESKLDNFDDIWKEIFINKFENDKLFDKSNDKYSDPIIQQLYNKFSDFFNQRNEIKQKIEELVDKKNKILEKLKQKYN